MDNPHDGNVTIPYITFQNSKYDWIEILYNQNTSTKCSSQGCMCRLICLMQESTFEEINLAIL
jgi:hypothetical protein